MSKGYATSTVIKLLACMIALVIVVYLIYRYVLHSEIGKQECGAKMIAWCAGCQLAGWAGGPGMNEALKECAEDHFLIKNNECNNQAENDCKAFLPSTD